MMDLTLDPLLAIDMVSFIDHLPALLWLVYTAVYVVVLRCALMALFNVFSLQGFVVALTYTLSMGSMGVSHLLAALSNPTVVTTTTVPEGIREPRFCNLCPGRPWKPPRAHHCRDCDRCVFLRHHHCVITGNCVGWGNRRFFLLFLALASMALLESIALLLLSFVSLLIEPRMSAPWPSLLFACVLGTAALYACLKGLTLIFENMEEQWRSTTTNTTPTEASRNLFGTPADAALSVALARIFGSRPPNFCEQVFHKNPLTGLVEEATCEVLAGYSDDSFGSQACRLPSASALAEKRKHQSR